jgi:hypothetical protein
MLTKLSAFAMRTTLSALVSCLLPLSAALADENANQDQDAARLAAIKAHLADIIVPDVRLAFEEAGPRGITVCVFA